MQLADSNAGEMNPPLVMLHMEPKMDFIPEDVDYIAPLYKMALRAGTLSTTGECHLLTYNCLLLAQKRPGIFLTYDACNGCLF